MLFRLIRFLVVPTIFLFLVGCASLPETTTEETSTLTPYPTQTQIASPTSISHFTPTSAITETPARAMGNEVHDCSQVEQLPTDSAEAQQILDEFVANYKEQYPTEYMGMAILNRVYRLEDWAVVTGSITEEGTDVIAVRQTSMGYQIAEMIHIFPLESPEELETWVIQPFLAKLPEAPAALFTCMDQSWLQLGWQSSKPVGVYQLAYISSDDSTTEGVTEIHTLLSDGSNQTVLLHEPMLITGLASSPDGERIAFWGCQGSLANDCLPDEDLDVWVVNWDGANLVNLTGDSAESDSHPDWSPDGMQIVFDSRRSGKAEIYIMKSDGSNPHVITSGPGENTEPKWSPDGKWIAYHCNQAGETRICVVSLDGQPPGEPISGTMPVWSPASPDEELRLAFQCFKEGQSDICTVLPDGSDLTNLTDNPADEHSAAWSPDGNWLAFVSNQGNDIDIYKVCAICPGEHVAVRLTDEVRHAMWPAWSPNGSQVAYADEPGGTFLLVNADRSGVTYLASGVFSPSIWRPELNEK